jgi:uncharacterized protein (TIGR02246 family)
MMRFCSIKSVTYLITFLSLLGSTPVAWAGAAEDIGAINQQRTAAFEKGDVDGYMVVFADNAVFTPALQPFRVEGKAAIKEYFTTLFQTYPTRRIVAGQGSTRVCGNDTVVVSDAYLILTLTDKSSTVSVYHLRGSTTWLKTASEWHIVDQHVSRMPIP